MDENELDLGERLASIEPVNEKVNTTTDALLRDIANSLRKIEVVLEFKALVAAEQLAMLQEDEDENSDTSRGI